MHCTSLHITRQNIKHHNISAAFFVLLFFVLCADLKQALKVIEGINTVGYQEQNMLLLKKMPLIEKDYKIVPT